MSFFMNKEMSNYFNQTQPTQHLPMHQLSPVVKGLYVDRSRAGGSNLSLFSPYPSSVEVYGYIPDYSTMAHITAHLLEG